MAEELSGLIFSGDIIGDTEDAVLPVEVGIADPSTRSRSCRKFSLVPLAANERLGNKRRKRT